MRHYEVNFIVDPVLSGDEIKATAQTYVDMLKNEGATIVHVEDVGLKPLAYSINKRSSGIYFCIEFTLETGTIDKMELALRRDERIMRFLTVSLDKFGVKYNEDKRAGKIGKKARKETEAVVETRGGRTETAPVAEAKAAAPAVAAPVVAAAVVAAPAIAEAIAPEVTPEPIVAAEPEAAIQAEEALMVAAPEVEAPVEKAIAAESEVIKAPIAEEPAAEAAIAEEVVAEEPAVEAPIAEEVVAEEAPVEEQAAEETAEPVSDEAAPAEAEDAVTSNQEEE